MKQLFTIAVIVGFLFMAGCDTGSAPQNEEILPEDPFHQQNQEDEITGQLSPFELIQNPAYTPIHEIDYIHDNELVFVSKACGLVLVYPHRNMHVEVVNEEAHGVLMAVTYCPITRSGISWNRVLGNDTLLLTASGYLLNENLMPLDVNSGSIWSQMRLKGMKGKHDGMSVGTFPLMETTWKTAREHFPGAGVFTNQSLLKSAVFPIGQTFGIVSWSGVELFTLDMFPGEIFLQSTIVRPGGFVIVAGSSVYEYMVAFKTSYEMEPVEGEFPVIMKDETGTHWTIFGEAINGERGGEKLESPTFYSAADWAWMNLFENVTYFEPELP